MKKNNWVNTVISAAAFALLTACNGGSSTHSQNEINKDDKQLVGGMRKFSLNERIYYMTPPQDIPKNKAYKLLLAFHGSGGTGYGMAAMTQFHKQDDDYLVVYPKSKNEEWNEGCGCNKAHRLGIDDLGFVDDLIQQLKSQYDIIDGEIYAAGFSQGGLFVQNLLCNRSDVFQGIVTVAAPMSYQLGMACNLTTPTNYRIMHGKKDNVLPYHGQSGVNFGLFSSTQAIDIVAKLNTQQTKYIDEVIGQGVTLRYYPDKSVKTELISVAQASHNWNLSPVETTKSIMTFFKSSSRHPLPTGSDLYQVSGNYYHVRHTLAQPEKPTVVMLSGANMHFHSDSAWFALLQPYLETKFNVVVIDRLGQGLSSTVEAPSMAQFAADLPVLFNKLALNDVHLLSFANSNSVPLIAMQQSGEFKQQVASMLWLDPDILMPHSVALYQGFPVDLYRDYGQTLIDHVAAGNWQEKMDGKITAEKAHVEALMANNDYAQYMDWDYFNLIMQTRHSIAAQLTRVHEVMNYHDDLELVKDWQPDGSIPISIIDSDFESENIAQAEDEALKAKLLKWQSEGRKWSQEVATASGGQYIPLSSTEHLIPFTHPEVIEQALLELSQ
ncbi:MULTISPECIES: alpha/beta hydrolase [unclassified Pseudoalteromonas]|uniref:alpha/beta hydrolase n=1 Tax=unclassified Pseudoalteromonas TaxID=194690 RepID=UPI0030151174